MLQSPRATRFIYLHTYWVRGTDGKWEGAGPVWWGRLGFIEQKCTQNKKKKKKIAAQHKFAIDSFCQMCKRETFVFAHCVGSNTANHSGFFEFEYGEDAFPQLHLPPTLILAFLSSAPPPIPPPPTTTTTPTPATLPPDHQDSVLLSGGERQARRATHSRSINRLSLMRDTERPRGRSPDSLSLQNTHAKIYRIISECGRESWVFQKEANYNRT